MTILRDFSLIWSLIHTLVLYMMLFDSRYPKRKTFIIMLSAMLPLILINSVLFVIFGVNNYMKLMLLTLTLPSLIFFFFLAKHRDGRFVFTFCMIDTIVLEIVYITNIIDYYIPGDMYLSMFTIRLLVFPAIEWLVYKKYRLMYRDIQRKITKGWATFALIGALFYITMTLAMSYPTMVTERPEYLPVVSLLFILMPLSYFNILTTLLTQQKAHDESEQKHISTLQFDNMRERIEVLAEADKKFRMERHNFRHKMKTISSLVEKEQYDELRSLVMVYNEAINKTQVKHYSSNAVIDAVLSSYLQKAEGIGIKVTTGIAFPEPLPADVTELATVLANAIENAIHACEKLDEEKRFIDLKVLTLPRFMIQISNSYIGDIEFDSDGIPVTHEEGHGFGTRSIAAFCEKHNAYCDFKAENEKFSLRIMFK